MPSAYRRARRGLRGLSRAQLLNLISFARALPFCLCVRRTEAKDLTSGIKLLLGKSLGITPTDENKAFAQEVRAALPASATKLVVACGFGGSIYGNEYSPSTAPSRSITAVGKLLMEAGYESSFVCHCDAPMRELLAAMADEKADAL